MKALLHSGLFNFITGATNGAYWIEECDKSEADDVISKHHYSKKATKNSFLSLRVNGGKGYLQLGYGIRPVIKGDIHPLIKKGNYAEFDLSLIHI